MPPPPAALVPLLQPAAASAQLAAGTPLRPAGSPAKAPVDPEQEAINSPIMVSTTAAGGGEPPPAPRPAAGRASLDPEGGSATSAMAGLLKPTELPGFRASVMQHPGTTIEQGRIIQCRNVTPMTSGLVGFVQAKIAYDVWSADGTMKLIDRDSTIFGEIGHGLANGQERLFVLWRQVTTPPPNLVRITLNSPAADEMGEAGVPGDINHHYWQKIGGALMLSGIESVFSGISGALSHLGESGSNNSNQSQGLNLNFSQMGSQGSNLASQLLQSTITIPDTLHRDQALPCSIFVSGDLDFGSVYSATRRTSSP
jgi:type IV secretion system protein VirB10